MSKNSIEKEKEDKDFGQKKMTRISEFDLATVFNIIDFKNWFSYDSVDEVCRPYFYNDANNDLQIFIGSPFVEEDRVHRAQLYHRLSLDAKEIITFVITTPDKTLKDYKIASAVHGRISLNRLKKHFRKRIGAFRTRLALREIKIFLKKM